MGKRKGDKEDLALLGRKKGCGKGLSNIIHVYRDERKVVTQAEIYSQSESYSQEPQPEGQVLQSEAHESQTSELQIQKVTISTNIESGHQF